MRFAPILAVALASGCMRQVVLNPEPEGAMGHIPASVRVEVGKITAESNAANPISFDFKSAAAEYARKRGTFDSVVDGPADLALRLSSDFHFSSMTRFTYTFKIRATLTAGDAPIGQYFSEATATGGMTRLTAAADQGPTNEAFTKAMDELFLRIESDRANIVARLGKGESAPVAKKEETRAPVSDVDAPGYRKDERPNDFALVIGIEKYESLPAADFAEHDAAAVKRHLLALGYPERNVIYLTGAKASKTGIEKYVETWLPMNVKDDSNVFVYFSGHGAPDAATGQAYLVPWDGDAKFLKNTGYPIKQLYANLNALKAKKIVLAMDSCFSGEGGRSVLAKGARPLVTKVDAGVEAGGKLVVLAAAGGDEITGADDAQGHGLFTYYLLDGLKKNDGDASVKRLYSYLLPRVQDAARRDGRQQTPQLMPAGADARP